ncbi:MAG: PmeII family type II restriction endonuclease [Candidatus Poribacteria bacterium]|nr:PmeII family type II restriction endonuclease [Candidatus Poribacteria bacterium]
MIEISMDEVREYVEAHIHTFHQKRLDLLDRTKLPDLLKRKNPYLFRAKNLMTAQDVVVSLLDAVLSSSEEQLFGNFLEDLAIFVAGKTLNAQSASGYGLDFQFQEGRSMNLVSVKSGKNWGNSSQWKALADNFLKARRTLMQKSDIDYVEFILGVCYGNAKITRPRKGLILQLCGQTFWHRISGVKSFYIDIVEPIGHRARENNDAFTENKAAVINRCTQGFMRDYCDASGRIAWDEIVRFNSANYDDHATFIEEQCRFDDDVSVPKSDLYAAYRTWCRSNQDAQPMTKAAFNKRIITFDGVTSDRGDYVGITLK